MQFIKPDTFSADYAWGALPIAHMENATVKLHWTNAPYKWHVNDGEEVFVVLGGVVDMHYKVNDLEHVQRMDVGDICFAEQGDEHVAHPIGEARILVVEKAGSI